MIPVFIDTKKEELTRFEKGGAIHVADFVESQQTGGPFEHMVRLGLCQVFMRAVIPTRPRQDDHLVKEILSIDVQANSDVRVILPPSELL